MNIQDQFLLGLTGLISLGVQGTPKNLLQYHSSNDNILVSCCCCNKCHKFKCLKAVQMYHLIALDTRSPRMGQQRCTAFHGSLREYVSLRFSGSRGFTHSFVHGLESCQLLLIYLFGCNRSLLQHV